MRSNAAKIESIWPKSLSGHRCWSCEEDVLRKNVSSGLGGLGRDVTIVAKLNPGDLLGHIGVETCMMGLRRLSEIQSQQI